MRNTAGDYKLAPAYDLIDTQIHLPGDSIFALQKGLFADGRRFPPGIANKDFHAFGTALGIPEKTVTRELERFTADYPEIARMVESSFLSEESKQNFYSHYHTRLVSFLRA